MGRAEWEVGSGDQKGALIGESKKETLWRGNWNRGSHAGVGASLLWPGWGGEKGMDCLNEQNRELPLHLLPLLFSLLLSPSARLCWISNSSEWDQRRRADESIPRLDPASHGQPPALLLVSERAEAREGGSDQKGGDRTETGEEGREGEKKGRREKVIACQ